MGHIGISKREKDEEFRVMRVGSDTFGDPIFQKGLQNQPSSGIMSVLGCFA